VGVLLRSIELFGFKSFADRTNIEFSEGVSALLGPNGCGKSNVVDAIKWVLGEQATRSLRAERMEDVIFNGTDSRKALNVADVTLTLANEDGVLPIDRAEITLRRRLFRNGESEYYVNGEPVLLRELRELFYDTGIGKTAYSIMEQGKIDRVLSDRPEERRAIFEEVAGITRHKVRGQEAERRLARTEENMRQVESILSEVRRTHDNLKAQSEKTLVYREIRQQAFEVELDHTLLRLRSSVEERDKRSSQLEKKTAARDKLKKIIDSINESLEENLDRVNTMESSLIEHQKRLYGVELEKQNKANEIRIHEERVAELTTRIDGDERRREALVEHLKATGKEIQEIRALISEQSARISDVESNIESFTTRVSHAVERIEANHKSIHEQEFSIAAEESRQAELDKALREITDDIVRALDEGLAQSDYSDAARKDAEAKVETGVQELTKRLESARAILTDGISTGRPEKVAKTLDTALSRVASALASLRESIAAYGARIPAFIDEFLAPEGIITRKRDIDSSIAACRESIRTCRSSIAELTSDNNTIAGRIQEYRATLEELRMNRVRMATQASAMEERVEERERALAEEEHALEQHEVGLQNARTRLEETRDRITELAAESRSLQERETRLTAEQRKLELAIEELNETLVKDERELKSRMEELGSTQTQLEKLQVSVAESGAEIRNLYENFRERFSLELSDYEPRMLELDATPSDLRRRLAVLRDRERDLGPVNLAAPEEYEEVRQRFEFLRDQLQDLTQARSDLNRVTREIQTESSVLFTETYEKVKRNFHLAFRRLFGGGRAELKLTDPENVLESGVEIFAQPPGKKLENIALLSGGERSLTAVALLFATYMVRPSPFCLLDEIDAALDESNVGRFTNMLMEFGESSQFIVITHNKKTVAAAGTLLGITMEESGVSKVVAIRLGGREELHAV
jgi:chromosome segregation protein